MNSDFKHNPLDELQEHLAPEQGPDAGGFFLLPEEEPLLEGDVLDPQATSIQLSGDSTEHLPDGLDVATTAGEILLANGAEIFRVQDTMNRILQSYETEPFNVFVISNAIMANVERGGQAKSAVIRYIPLGPNHLGRVAKVNAISRRITAGELNAADALKALEEVRYSDDTTILIRAAATAIGSAGFAILVGGTWYAFAITCITSFLLYYFMAFLERFAVARIMTNILGAMFVSTLALFIVKGIEISLPGVPIDFSNVIIGSIMQLVPGMSLTTAVREILNTDYLSGVIRTIDVITLGFGIAFGVAISLWLIQPLLGVGA